MSTSQNQVPTESATVENTNIQSILSILRSEVEKTLTSATQHKLNRTLTSDELNDCCTNGVNELLKIYSTKSLEKTTDEVSQEKSESDQKNKSELSSLLNIVALSSNQIFDNVHKEFEVQSKKKLDKKEVLNFLIEASEQQESSNDSEEDEDEEDDEKNDEEDEEAEEEEEDEEEEEENPMTEEEFQQEIAEAFENIRRLGHSDGRRLARFVRDSFCEINGREPELREMADVFSRIKNKLAEEAKDDKELLSSSRNIIIKDDLTNTDDVEQTQSANVSTKDSEPQNEIVKKMGWLNIDVNNANKEEKEELLKFARSIVKEDLQVQAKNQLGKLIGREPTKQELNDMLVQLATTSLLDCNFDSSDDASDYNPDAQEEKQQLVNDIKETEEFDEENSREQEEPTLINKPVLTTPVKNKGNSSRVDYYFEQYNDDCSELLINKAVWSFKKLHDRMPSNEEVDKIKHFLHTEKANLLTEQALTNENDKENTSFKLNFGAEDPVDAQ